MKDQNVEPRLVAVRPDAWPPPHQPGERIALRLPVAFFKEAPDTLVWADAVDGVGRVFFKMYRRRGLLSWWKGTRSHFRAEREFRRLGILYNHRVPCVEPLMCCVGRSPVHGRYEIIATREIPHAHQFRRYLVEHQAKLGDVDLQPLFHTIRAMHAAGVYHGTLTPNNIVIATPPGRPPAYHVVDLPRAIDFPHDLAGTRMALYDLLHFIHRCTPFLGRAACLPVLDRYALTPAQREEFMRRLTAYRPGKWLRYRLRNEFGLRARVAPRR